MMININSFLQKKYSNNNNPNLQQIPPGKVL